MVTAQSPSFAVVIPMFDEEHGAEACVRAVCAKLEELPHRNLLIAVDDGSADGTGPILDRLALQFPRLRVLHHPQNRGYGGALSSGAGRAAQEGFDYVLFMDSDLTNDPRYLSLFIEKMALGFDLIKASRYMRGGGVRGVPWWRVLISRVGNLVAGLLYRLPLHDCTNGFRAIRTSVFQRMPLRESRFSIIMEELYHARRMGCSVVEIPNELGNRHESLRPTSFSYRPQTFWRYLKYPLRSSIGL